MSLYDKDGLTISLGEGTGDDTINNMFGGLEGYIAAINGIDVLIHKVVEYRSNGDFQLVGQLWKHEDFGDERRAPDFYVDWDEIDTIYVY
jgi:hypothetical protein